MPPFFPRIPDVNNLEVKRLFESLSPGASCQLLKIETIEGAVENECFQNVEKAISLHGGTIRYGWKVIEGLPNLMLEAEFHAVWVKPDGQLCEVSPSSIPGLSSILFLPNESLIYDGKQVDNVRVPLKDDPLVIDFISVAESFYTAMNRGEMALYHGQVQMTPEMIALQYRQRDLMIKIIEKFYS